MDSPFAKLKVVELKGQLAAKGLSTKGLKKDLVERLEAACNDTSDLEADGMQGAETGRKEKLGSVCKGDAKEEDKETVFDQPDNDTDDVVDETIDNEGRMLKEDGSNAQDRLDNGAGDVTREEPNVQDGQRQINTKYGKESSIVKITNFVRPFTQEEVQAMLGQYGIITAFWMDKLRTVAFVEYDSIEAAELCKFHVNGMQWPMGTGKALTVESSSAELMNAAINAPVIPRIGSSRPDHKIMLADSSRQHPPSDHSNELDKLFLKTKTRPHIYYLPKHPQ